MTGSRLGSWLRRQHGSLASGRLTVWLLAVLVLLLCAHLFLHVLHAPLFAGTCALMFVNLSLCMIRRLRATLGAWRFPAEPPRPSSDWLHREVAHSDLGAERIAELLRDAGYRTFVSEGSVYGLRGRFAVLGHWLFHLGLLALLVSGFFIAVAPQPFRGMVGVGEREPFDLHAARFLSSNAPVGPELPGLRFRLEDLEVVTDGLEVRRYEARLTTTEGAPATLGINRPFRAAPYQVMVHGFGYMAGWVVVDARDRMRNGAWVKLVPFPLERFDAFSLGVEESEVAVRLFPDYERDGEEDRSRGYELNNPRFAARVTWRGEQIHNGLLEPEQRVALEGDLELFFLPEIRRYALLEVIQERGHGSVFTCLGVMILGLLVRYLRVRKEILVEGNAGVLQVYGSGESFESLFVEEFERLVDGLAGARAPLQDRKATT
jgi:hypothetical protein